MKKVTLLLIALIAFVSITNAQINAIDFDGNDDYASTGTMIPYTGTFSILGWARTIDDHGTYLSWGDNATWNY